MAPPVMVASCCPGRCRPWRRGCTFSGQGRCGALTRWGRPRCRTAPWAQGAVPWGRLTQLACRAVRLPTELGVPRVALAVHRGMVTLVAPVMAVRVVLVVTVEALAVAVVVVVVRRMGWGCQLWTRQAMVLCCLPPLLRLTGPGLGVPPSFPPAPSCRPQTVAHWPSRPPTVEWHHLACPQLGMPRVQACCFRPQAPPLGILGGSGSCPACLGWTACLCQVGRAVVVVPWLRLGCC